MESALILVELTKIRVLLTVFVLLAAVVLVAALAVAVAHLFRFFDKWSDNIIDEMERQNSKTPL